MSESQIFYSVIGFIIAQRLIELVIARRNELYIKSQGGYEVGASHYPVMVALHTGWFISMIAEHVFTSRGISELWILWGGLFLLSQLGRIHVITTLGKFWNTRILILPNAKLVRQGLYKYLRHPNYWIVRTEIFVVPMLFNLWITAVLFTVANYFMLRVRIQAEDEALLKLS